ncbi:YcxB family protein [Streptomyces sp. Q6]|uniref:YcxB family protein n=1 Tax=Streptomyces citrinus TaxID=3118173 RepID=A0ACD5AAC1_9ACTN
MHHTGIPAAPSVELEYRPTLRQCEEAGQARRAASDRDRRSRIVTVVFAVLAVLLAARDGGAASAGLIGVAIGLVVRVFVVRPRREDRALHARAVRRGGHRATVDANGVHVEHELGSEAIAWAGVRRFVETENLVVLLDEDAAEATALPKEGLSREDADRLRRLLDEHLGRG